MRERDIRDLLAGIEHVFRAWQPLVTAEMEILTQEGPVLTELRRLHTLKAFLLLPDAGREAMRTGFATDGVYDPQTCTAESTKPAELFAYLLMLPEEELAAALWHQFDECRRQFHMLNVLSSQETHSAA